MRSASLIGRVAAVAAIAIAIVAVAVILLSSGSTYQVRAIFQNASQIVQGDLVQVAGALGAEEVLRRVRAVSAA